VWLDKRCKSLICQYCRCLDSAYEPGGREFDERRLLDQPGEVITEGDDTLAVIASASEIVTADYDRPWETHARMEPINATANVTPARVDVWSPTQD